MTSADDRPMLEPDGPAELLAIVPYLLGFHPTASLVVIGLATSTTSIILCTALPDTQEETHATTAALRRSAALLRDHGATTAVLIGYGTVEQVDPILPVATTALAAASVRVTTTLRVEAGRYWHVGGDSTDCPPDGVAFDPTTSVMAAAATVAGLVALPDRAAVAARLAPVTGDARARMLEAIDAAMRDLLSLVEAAASDADGDDGRARAALVAEAQARLEQARTCYQAGKPVDDQLAAVLITLVAVPAVRVFVVRGATSARWEIEMWVDLVRRAQLNFVTSPALILTACALLAGDGVLARNAVQRALGAEPNGQLARAMAGIVSLGVNPETFADLLGSIANDD